MSPELPPEPEPEPEPGLEDFSEELREAGAELEALQSALESEQESLGAIVRDRQAAELAWLSTQAGKASGRALALAGQAWLLMPTLEEAVARPAGRLAGAVARVAREGTLVAYEAAVEDCLPAAVRAGRRARQKASDRAAALLKEWRRRAMAALFFGKILVLSVRIWDIDQKVCHLQKKASCPISLVLRGTQAASQQVWVGIIVSGGGVCVCVC